MTLSPAISLYRIRLFIIFPLQNASLCHLTFEDHMRTQKKTNDFLKQLKDINRSELSRREQLVYDVLLEYYNLEGKMEDYYYYQNLLSPTAGIRFLSSHSFIRL